MRRWLKNNRQQLIDKRKLIHMPLWIILISIVTVSVVGSLMSRSLLLEEIEREAKSIAENVVRQIEVSSQALDIIHKNLEDKIRIVGDIVIKNQDLLSNEFLVELKNTYEVDELNWMDNKGNTLYSWRGDEGVGWFPDEEHPLHSFANSDSKEMMEDIRPNTVSGVPMKYGSMKDEKGYIVQVGLSANKIYELTEEISYDSLVKEIVKNDNVLYVDLIDNNRNIIASMKTGTNQTASNETSKNLVDNGLNGKIDGVEYYDDGLDQDVYGIVAPFYKEGNLLGIVHIVFSAEQLDDYMIKLLSASTLITILMYIIVLWVQNKNVIKPVDRLNTNINKIDLENNLHYRLPYDKEDPFSGISMSINNVIDRIDKHIIEIQEHKKELSIANEEISVAYEQLAVSEEELRVQCDEIQEYADRLEELEQKYTIAIESTNSAVWEINISDNTIYFSKGFSNFIENDINEREKLEDVLANFLKEADQEKFINNYYECKNGKIEEMFVRVEVDMNENQTSHMLIRGKGVFDDHNKIKYISGIILDITVLREQAEYIEYLAYNDFLTDLPNRRSFYERLKKSIENNKYGAVMLLDIDNFKEVNDTLGHAYGDQVLKRVAQAFKDIDDDKMFVSRFGGDEFFIMIEDESDKKVIEEYAEKIIDIFKNKRWTEENEIYISASLGITRYPYDSSEVSQLLMNADMTMYSVKNQGKNNYNFFNEGMVEKINEQMKVEKALRKGIEENDFKLLYQPKVCTETGKIIAYEALIRLKNTTVPPNVFIRVAEENGMIIQIGRWVLEEVIKQIRVWKDKGLEIKPVSINFSAKQLRDTEYIDFLQEILAREEVEEKHIEIEITESIFLDQEDETIVFLNKFKSLGMKISLDDFGKGYSSLSYLTFLPVDIVKLDKTLCDKFLEIDNVEVMENIISLVHSLNLEVVAEGVELKEQYKRLNAAKCDYIQGYLFSKPIEPEEVEKINGSNLLEMVD